MAIEVNGEKIKVVDAHTHSGKRPKAFSRVISQYGIKELVENLDACGIDKCVVFPLGAFPLDYSEMNSFISKGMGEFPERVVGFGRINPRFGKQRVEEIFDECMRMGLRGIKLHPIGDGFDAGNHELLRPIIEKARHYKVPLIFHCGMAVAASPALISDLACDNPDVPFILGHMGYRERGDEAIAVAKRVKNLYLETSQVGNIPLLAHAVETLGPERVVYGSDHPYQPLDFELEKIAKHLRKYMGLGNESLKKILGENVEGLLANRTI